VWTIGMISALTEAGADSATFFTTTGDKGLMDNGGPVFPIYHVFRAIAGAKEVLDCNVSDRFAIATLAVRIESGVRIIVGNYTRNKIEAQLRIAPDAVIRRLNKETAAPALEQPDSIWSETSATLLNEGPLRLAPFEIVFIDQPILPDAF